VRERLEREHRAESREGGAEPRASVGRAARSGVLVHDDLTAVVCWDPCLLHELGHFLVAKGRRVGGPEVLFGVGPKSGREERETEYLISALPLRLRQR